MHQLAAPRPHVHFDAVLYPHRSLSPTGFFWLMAAIGAGCGAVGLLFLFLGAWPVIGFLGLDLLLIFFAFRLSYRRGRDYELVRLTDEVLEIVRFERGRQQDTTRFQPYWLQVVTESDGRLRLGSHGRWCEIGHFLGVDERSEFAQALRMALGQWRDGHTK